MRDVRGLALGLQTRLIVASAAIVVLAVVATSGVFVYRDHQEQRAEALRQIAAATQSFSISAAPLTAGVPLVTFEAVEAGTVVDTGDVMFEVMAGDLLPAYRILMVDGTGKVVTDPAGTLAGTKIDYPVATAGQRGDFVTWNDDATAAAGITFLAAGPDVRADGLTAVAAIDSGSLTSDWLATAPDLALSALAALPFATGAAILVTRRVTRPLRSLTRAADGISRGDFDQRVDVRGADEVAQLARSFTAMADRVRDRDAQLRDLIANVSHDLRTPLTSIQGYAEAIADGVADPATVDETARIIRDEAREAAGLLANLLSLGEIESGEVVMRHEEYDVADLIARCVRRLDPAARARGVAILVRGEVAPTLVGDPDKIERALCNVIDNALKFAHAQVEVDVAREETSLAIAVRNDGPAIPTEEAERIFDRFYRAPGSRGGSGLGLAIAREFVEIHGGHLVLSSAGTPVEFRFALPLTARTTA